MKYLLLVFLLFQNFLCLANMASPEAFRTHGTDAALAFSSKDVDIVHEKIRVDLAKDLLTATFTIEYDIESDVDGKQMPLLFYAMNYQGDFNVWVDGQQINTTNLPDNYFYNKSPRLANFNERHLNHLVDVQWEGADEASYSCSDLKYFETSLTKGFHKIRVQYVALRSSIRNKWIMPSNFSYSLAPAKYWRSFGTLQIILNTHNYPATLTTSLDHYKHLRTDSIMVWEFKALPADIFEIDCEPKVSWFANLLLGIGPCGLTSILALFLFVAHIKLIMNHRKTKRSGHLSLLVYACCIFIPFILLVFLLLSFELICTAIGEDAGNVYSGLGLLIYFGVFATLIFIPIYLLLTLLIDSIIKQIVKRNAN